MNRKSYLAGLPSDDSDDERDEKSWQKVPSIVILLLLGAYLTLGYLTQLVEDDMPKVIYEEDIQKDDAETFSEESARNYLDQILGTEPRVAGTAYHYEKTKDLKALIDSIAAQANLPVRTDWQFVSGDYWLASSVPQVNCYKNLSNIIAILEGESGFHANGTIGTSLLVNCHYDSVPFAIGASDNGVFCAVMVETLSKLSRRKRKLKHNVIFLFNGAEENPLQDLLRGQPTPGRADEGATRGDDGPQSKSYQGLVPKQTVQGQEEDLAAQNANAAGEGGGAAAGLHVAGRAAGGGRAGAARGGRAAAGGERVPAALEGAVGLRAARRLGPRAAPQCRLPAPRQPDARVRRTVAAAAAAGAGRGQLRHVPRERRQLAALALVPSHLIASTREGRTTAVFQIENKNCQVATPRGNCLYVCECDQTKLVFFCCYCCNKLL